MPCFHPHSGFKNPDGTTTLWKQNNPDAYAIDVPCGGCLGCRMAKAKAWTLRCTLEMQQHQHTAWTTLTYRDYHRSITLNFDDLQRWLKRLRKQHAMETGRPIRFFGTGEYGTQTNRAHFHVLLYGINADTARSTIETTWGLGHTRTVHANPATIAYTAGYCFEKLEHVPKRPELRVDPNTGEEYTWIPPQLRMSRNPGIGANGKQWPDMWKLFAINDGHKQKVPRYLQDAYKQQATQEELEQLEYEKYKLALRRDTQETKEYRNNAMELILKKQQQAQREKKAL